MSLFLKASIKLKQQNSSRNQRQTAHRGKHVRRPRQHVANNTPRDPLPPRRPRENTTNNSRQQPSNKNSGSDNKKRPRNFPPAAALGLNLPDLKKLPNTKFDCDGNGR